MDQKKGVIAKYEVGGKKKIMWWILQNYSCGVYKMSGSVYFLSQNKSLNHC